MLASISQGTEREMITFMEFSQFDFLEQSFTLKALFSHADLFSF